MKLRRERKKFIVPMNSMSDVAFLLLVFIMLLSLINYRREVKIDYPEAAAAKRTSAEKNLEIWVDKAGAVYLDGLPSDLGAIEIAITDIYQDAPDTRVHVIADRDTSFRDVNRVLQTLQLLQYRVVSFVVKDE
ncbi:putative biopolymer transport ExbD protein [Treponema primitia ZAS-2]|uniref:Putative biopolymer transport ExbD protein n=1 Tax=Treponema primitia (strain ATCC BAA-887 / DSM 12427 / ZAS-2) TaxID=545694 RepID=F5YJN9_TREPZ|nr:biopolymer transporter ExbD [Treponema primitia]AEF85277.1 putative biopolymer transport ExbD protein [Treponema primitia ZAS-2]